ncbi:hypothetical protein EBR43_01045 [bacterium]|nr:hypothetical protein [bacterium]
MKLSDSPERIQALDLTTSCVVRAPAGSGKTELLIQRYLKALLHVERPEQALVLTFTNKAVAELKERLMHILSDPSSCATVLTAQMVHAVIQRSALLGWNISYNQHRLAIMTIDAYFLKLYERFMPQELGVFPTLTDDPIALNIKIVEEFLSYYFMKEADEDLIALSAIFHNNFSYLKDLFVGMLGSKERWLALLYQERLESQALESLWIAELEILNSSVSHLASCVEQIFSFMTQYHLITPHFIWPMKLEQWFFLSKILLTQKAQWRKTFRFDQGIPAQGELHPWHTKEDRINAIENIAELQESLSQAASSLKILGLMQYWPDHVSFSENDQRLAFLLKKLVAFSIVYKKEKSLLDFADITTGLWSLTRKEPELSWIATYLDQHLTYLFIDEVQDLSLTQFAIIEQIIGSLAYVEKSFFVVGDPQQAIYHFRGAEIGVFRRFELYANPGIKKVNLKLSSNFRSADKLVSFVNTWTAERFGDASLPLLGVDQALTSYAALAKDGSYQSHSYTNKEQEAWQLALLIKTYRQEHPQRTVGILGRDRKTLRPLKAMLDRLDIEHHAPDLHRMIDQYYILDALALIKVLLEPREKYHWLDLLRSSLLRASFADIQLFFADEQVDFWQKSSLHTLSSACAYDYQRLSEVVGVFNTYRYRGFMIEDQCNRKTVHGGVESVITLLTIHKSKGLEFDCVILPNLGARLPTAERPLLSYIHWDSFALWSVAQQEDNQIFNFCHKVNTCHQAHEAERLLYVALTRAKQTLILSRNEQASSPRSFWRMLDGMLIDDQAYVDLTLPSGLINRFAKIPQHYKVSAMFFDLVAMNNDPIMITIPNFYHELQRIVGLVIHDLLACTETLPIESTLLTKDALRMLWKKHGGQPQYFQQGLDQLGKLIVQIHRSKLALSIFNKDHLHVYPEYELFYMKRNKVKKIILDRFIQKSDGQWWIIEFKSMLQSSLTKEQIQEYQQQVKNYIEVAQAHLKTSVKGSLYFIADDAFVFL